MATDVTGYRSDGGSLGQQQNVSDQLRKILSNKLPLLNSPGTVIENSLYYDVTSSSVAAVEMQETFAKDRIAMSTFNFGSAPTAYIPSVLFASSVSLVATLPQFAYNVSSGGLIDIETDYFYAPSGWLFNCIQSVIVYMGACSIAQIEIDGWSNYMIAMACCETAQKRSAIIDAGGSMLTNMHNNSNSTVKTLMAGCPEDINKAYVSWSSRNPGNSIFVLNPAFMGQLANGGSGNICYYPMATAIIPIRLPFSSVAALDRKLPFDCKLSTQPIQITLQLKSFDECFRVGSTFKNSTIKNSFSSLALELWQEELSDKSLSVRNELLAMPQFNVGYPFQYTQSIPFQFPTSDQGLGQVAFNVSSYNQTQITMNITSIINSDLTTMLFMVSHPLRASTQDFPINYPTKTDDTITLTPYDANQFCPLYGEKLTNMQLYLNGQRFFAFEQDIYDGATLVKQLDTTKISMAMPNPAPKESNWGANTLDMFSASSNLYELNMSRLRSIVCESHMQNTARFTNQTFQLVFNVERVLYYPAFITPEQCKQGCILHMAYLYNGVILVGGDGGTTKLVTN